jgi:hypothetical protein
MDLASLLAQIAAGPAGAAPAARGKAAAAAANDPNNAALALNAVLVKERAAHAAALRKLEEANKDLSARLEQESAARLKLENALALLAPLVSQADVAAVLSSSSAQLAVPATPAAAASADEEPDEPAPPSAQLRPISQPRINHAASSTAAPSAPAAAAVARPAAPASSSSAAAAGGPATLDEWRALNWQGHQKAFSAWRQQLPGALKAAVQAYGNGAMISASYRVLRGQTPSQAMDAAAFDRAVSAGTLEDVVAEISGQ